MKVGTFLVAAVLLALSASMVAGSFNFNKFTNRDEFTAGGYFVDVIISFSSYVDEFLPIGTRFGSIYPAGSVPSSRYDGYDFSGNANYFGQDSLPYETAFLEAFARFSYQSTDYLLGGVGNGYVFSEGDGIGLVFTTPVTAVGIFLEAAGNVVDMAAVLFANNDQGDVDVYPLPGGNNHVQFWGVSKVGSNYIRDIGFAWMEDGWTADPTERSVQGGNAISDDFYNDKAFLASTRPDLAGIKHALLPAPYVGTLAPKSSRSIASETIVNVVDHHSLSLNMILAPVADQALFTTAAFTLADGSRLLIEALDDATFAVTLDDTRLSEGSAVSAADFTVRYDQFANMPRTAIAEGRSWFDETFADQQHTAIVRVATNEVVVDISLSLDNASDTSSLNVSLRDLQQHSTTGGLLKASDTLLRRAARQERAVDVDSMFENLVAAHAVDTLF